MEEPAFFSTLRSLHQERVEKERVKNLAKAAQDRNYQPPTEPELSRERSVVLDSLKCDVNRFLWSKLPPTMSLGEADHLACQIHDMVAAAWEEAELDRKSVV